MVYQEKIFIETIRVIVMNRIKRYTGTALQRSGVAQRVSIAIQCKWQFSAFDTIVVYYNGQLIYEMNAYFSKNRPRSM